MFFAQSELFKLKREHIRRIDFLSTLLWSPPTRVSGLIIKRRNAPCAIIKTKRLTID